MSHVIYTSSYALENSIILQQYVYNQSLDVIIIQA